MAVSATQLGVPITPIYGFGSKRWEGYEDLSGGLGTVYQQYVPPAMEPGVVASMAKNIPQPQPMFQRGQGPFNGLGYVRYDKIGPFHEGPVVRRMAMDLDTPLMAGASCCGLGAPATASQLYFRQQMNGLGAADDDKAKPTLKDAAIGIGIASVALVVGVSAVYWFAREIARG
jgi:hypothetical protein